MLAAGRASIGESFLKILSPIDIGATTNRVRDTIVGWGGAVRGRYEVDTFRNDSRINYTQVASPDRQLHIGWQNFLLIAMRISMQTL